MWCLTAASADLGGEDGLGVGSPVKEGSVELDWDVSAGGDLVGGGSCCVDLASLRVLTTFQVDTLLHGHQAHALNKGTLHLHVEEECIYCKVLYLPL